MVSTTYHLLYIEAFEIDYHYLEILIVRKNNIELLSGECLSVMEVSSSVLAGKRVLVVWYGGNTTESIQEVVEDLRGKAGGAGEVLLEHAERLLIGQYSDPQKLGSYLLFFFWLVAGHEGSSFDVILSGMISPHTLLHSGELLEEFVRVLKPSGVLYLVEPVSNGGEALLPFLSLMYMDLFVLCILYWGISPFNVHGSVCFANAFCIGSLRQLSLSSLYVDLFVLLMCIVLGV